MISSTETTLENGQPVPVGSGHLVLPPVLDACCGSRMFWFDKRDSRALFVDIRRETHDLPPRAKYPNGERVVIDPDLLADFTALPFGDATFALVVFDPPHLTERSRGGYMAAKYGKLSMDWKNYLARGFAECFRVLKADGVLVFKWNESRIPVSAVLALTPAKPLFGNRCGKSAKTHWVVFMKQNPEMSRAPGASAPSDVRPD